MACYIVDRCAHRFWKPSVVQRRWVCIIINCQAVNQNINLICSLAHLCEEETFPLSYLGTGKITSLFWIYVRITLTCLPTESNINRASLQLSLILSICATVLISGSFGPGCGTDVSKYDGRWTCSGTACLSLTKPGFTILYDPKSLLKMKRNKVCKYVNCDNYKMKLKCKSDLRSTVLHYDNLLFNLQPWNSKGGVSNETINNTVLWYATQYSQPWITPSYGMSVTIQEPWKTPYNDMPANTTVELKDH